ncbi:MAG: branched-chain amino acid ABC transporter permease, partial [Burkholderiaceae bacterium]
SYYLIFLVVVLCFLALLRIVNSPFGRVLQALRENDFRASAIGYNTLWFRVMASVLSALFATVAGFLLSVWLRYSGPDVSLSFELMVDILLMLVIGGMGTLYGAILGAALFLLAQSYLRDLLALAHTALEGQAFAVLFDPDRWLFWLGLLFVISVYTLPMGLVGKLRKY